MKEITKILKKKHIMNLSIKELFYDGNLNFTPLLQSYHNLTVIMVFLT